MFFPAATSVGLIQFGGIFGNIIWGYISDKTIKIVRYYYYDLHMYMYVVYMFLCCIESLSRFRS